MKNLSWWIAWRYVTHALYTSRVSLLLRVCIISIALASGALMMITTVMRGFQKALHHQMQTVHADAQIRSPQNPLNYAAIQDVLYNEFPEIIGVSPQYYKEILIQSEKASSPSLVILKGIIPEQEKKVTKILDTITELANGCIAENQIIIGVGLAKQLHAITGDQVKFFYIEDLAHASKKITLDTVTAQICARFKTGIDDIDMGVAYAHETFFTTYFPDEGVHQILLKLDSHANTQQVITRLKNRLNLPVYSWQELYPALMQALVLERWVMTLIVVLIALVASMNLIALLVMYITRKRGDIAILQALGMPITRIRVIFIMMGCFIAALATLGGVTCASGIIWILDVYQPYTLPSVYYASKLPIAIHIPTVVLICLGSITLSIITSWWAAQQTYDISVADLLRFEA